MVKYLQLLNLEIFHNYYSPEKFRNLQITPDIDTKQLMQSLGIRHQLQENSLRLFLPDSVNLKEKSDLVFQFLLVPSDPFFLNITADIPLNFQGTIAYANEAGSELTTTLNPGDQQLKISIQLNLSEAELDPANWPILYTLNFKTRSTRWKYFVISATPLADSTIEMTGKDATLFSGPTPEVLINGTNALVFDSAPNLIPLKKNSPLDLGIKTIDKDGKESIKITSLPMPSTDLTLPTANMEKDAYSSVYIYL